MPTIIIGQPANASVPFPYTAPIIEYAEDFSADDDDWFVEPSFTLESLALHAGSSQVSQCMLQRRYGQVMNPGAEDTGINAYDPADMTGNWIKVSLVDDQGDPQVQFLGKIETQSRVMLGSADSAAGVQTYLATGGGKLLLKQIVSTSYFPAADGTATEIGWVPPMNKRDQRGLLVGNRAASPGPGTGFLYSGKATTGDALWSHLDYLQYLVDNFLNQTDDNGDPVGPSWSLGGQTAILQNMKTTIDFEQAGSVSEMLHHLIPVKYGVDFVVNPSSDGAGFEITIFALVSQDLIFNGAHLIGNPNQVQVKRVGQLNLVDTRLVEEVGRRYDKIEVLGGRIVVCGTLRGKRAATNDPAPAAAGAAGGGTPTLVPKWSAAIEAAYIASIGEANSWDDDAARKREKYREVYKHFGAPVDWDLDGGKWAVFCGDNGKIQGGGTYQTGIRNTLNFIPLKAGYDYTTEPPTDNTLSGLEAEVKPPVAWIYDELPVGQYVAPRWVQCDLNSIHVSQPYLDWGVFLHPTPNHDLAKNHWTDMQLATTDRSEQRFDYETLIATIAIESDHRLRAVYKIPAAQAAGDGSVMTVLMPEAEAWVMLENTVLDLDDSGVLVTWPAGGPGDNFAGLRELRNDIVRLNLVMAGLIARYSYERVRGELTFKGLQNWGGSGGILGSMLTVIQQGDDVASVGSPVTSIVWSGTGEMKGGGGEGPKLVLKTGYA